jgi:uncharacterized protein YjiS (DUF1127 family)
MIDLDSLSIIEKTFVGPIGNFLPSWARHNSPSPQRGRLGRQRESFCRKEWTMLERSPSPSRRARLGAVVRRALSWPARVAEARRTLAFLGQMSNRELSDIGLLRSDLAHCAALPLDEDPTHKLAQLRAARAWYAPGRSTPRQGLAAVVRPESRQGIEDGDERSRLVGADHGDPSLFVMDYLTNIRWTDQ